MEIIEAIAVIIKVNLKIAKADVHTVQHNVDSSIAYQAVETVEFIVGKMTWKVTPIKPDNTKDGAVEASFDQTLKG